MKRILGLFVAFVTLILGTHSWGGPFTAGNIVVYRIGDGTAALTNIGTVVYLDEYRTNDLGFVQSVMMPTNFFGANYPLIANGTASADGYMTLSKDGRYLVVPGYGARIGGGSSVLSGISATTVPRIYGLVTGLGGVDTTTAQTNSLSDSPENPRSGASTDGTNLWITGDSGGLRYTTRGSPLATQLSTFITNLRHVNIYSNVLCFSDASGSAIRIGTITNAMPVTTGGSFMATLPGVPTNVGSPYGFVLIKQTGSADPFDTLYYADDTVSEAAIYKYSLVGATWTSNGFFKAANVRGLTGNRDASGKVRLFMTTAPVAGSGTYFGGGYIISYTDAAGYNAPPTGNGGDIGDPLYDSIVSVPSLKVARGIAFAPVGGDPVLSGPAAISVGPIVPVSRSGYTGCSVASTQTYSVANIGTAPVNWQVTSDVAWITLSPASGTGLASGNSVDVAATFNANALSLAAGTYTATLTFANTSNGIGNTTRTIQLTLVNQDVSPSSSLGMAGVAGGPFSPTNRVYTVSNGSTPITLAISKSQNWIDLSATSVSLGACASTNITVSINANANSLGNGFYSDVVSFSNMTAATLIETRNVSLAVGNVYFCDDFSTYLDGNLVGQQGWQQVTGDAGPPVLSVVGGKVVIPRTDSAINGQDAYKNIQFTSLTGSTKLYAGLLLSISNAPSLNPSYFFALNVTTNGTTGSNFANYRFTAISTNAGFTFAARITGQTGDPYTYGPTTLNYGQSYRVIIEAWPGPTGGTNMNVYVDPTSANLNDQTPYMIHPVAGGTPPPSIGDILISQFSNAGSALQIGVSFSKVCINTNYAEVYNGITGGATPTLPFVITSITKIGNDIKINWNAQPGTNVVQATNGAPGGSGSYSNNFVTISAPIIIPPSTYVDTMFTDVNGATNTPSRYYRIKLNP